MKTEKQQTAVEWFVEQLPMRIKNSMMGEIEQAKEMEKEQINEAYNQGQMDGFGLEEKDDYYSETFKSE